MPLPGCLKKSFHIKSYIDNVLLKPLLQIVYERGLGAVVLQQHEVLHAHALAVLQRVLHHALHGHRPQDPVEERK